MQRILYVSVLDKGATTSHRFQALQRLGNDMIPFALGDYQKSRLLSRLQFRFPMGPLIARINRDLLKKFAEVKPDFVWFDKPIFITPHTIQVIKAAGATTISSCSDNPFGPRKDGCWQQYYRIYRLIDLHCLYRQADVRRFEEWKINYIKLYFGFDPLQHSAPPESWSDRDRTREASFVGYPYENRPAFFLDLVDKYHVPLTISGWGWNKVFRGETRSRLESLGVLQDATGMLKDQEYSREIWRSKINISFVTHMNEEDVARKSFEIAGCGGFLLAERTDAHLGCFEEGKEAEFFASAEECAEKIHYYLKHPEQREAIARRGYERAYRSGYDNDSQMARVIERGMAIRAAL